MYYSKSIRDASYKLFISSISIFSQTQSADPLTPVPIQAEPEVEPEPEAEPEAESEAEPEAESEAEPEAEPILCLIASQDRQFIRDLIKTYLPLNQYQNLRMKIFF